MKLQLMFTLCFLFAGCQTGTKSMKETIELTLKEKEEKIIFSGLTVRLDSIGHESATSSPGGPVEVYGVYHFILKENGKTFTISTPLEGESAEPHRIDIYSLKLRSISSEGKAVTIYVTRNGEK